MLGNKLKTTVLLASLAGLFIGAGALMAGPIGAAIGLLIAFAINFGAFWYSDKMVLKMYKAKEVKSGRLYDMTRELASIAKLPMPKVYTITAPSPNAFATGRSPKNASVAATESLMQILTDDELRGVMAHELAHVKHRDTLIQTIAVGIATSIAFIAEMFQWMAIFGFASNSDDGGESAGSLVGMIALAILTPIIATLIQLAISRQREFMADAGAVKMTRSPEGLISALQKLEAGARPKPVHASAAPTESMFIINPFKGSGVAKLFSTHPPTSERIKAMRKLMRHSHR